MPEPVVTLRVELPDPLTDVGLNVPVAPAGSPLTLNETPALKPFEGVTVAVKLVPPPCSTL